CAHATSTSTAARTGSGSSVRRATARSAPQLELRASPQTLDHPTLFPVGHVAEALVVPRRIVDRELRSERLEPGVQRPICVVREKLGLLVRETVEIRPKLRQREDEVARESARVGPRVDGDVPLLDV